MSDEFRQLLQHAFREAARLGMNIDMNNADGFTGSGGPWVTVENSMKKLVWTEAHIAGGKRISLTLSRPETILGFYRDVSVIAFPRQRSLGKQMQAARPAFSAPDSQFKPKLLTDGDRKVRTRLWRQGGEGKPHLLVSLPESYTADTLMIQDISTGRGAPIATLEVSDDGLHYRPIGRMTLKWYPAAPTNTARFDACAAEHFRLGFSPNCQHVVVGEIALGRLIDEHFDSYRQLYDERFQAKYGYWRPIVEHCTDGRPAV